MPAEEDVHLTSDDAGDERRPQQGARHWQYQRPLVQATLSAISTAPLGSRLGSRWSMY